MTKVRLKRKRTSNFWELFCLSLGLAMLAPGGLFLIAQVVLVMAEIFGAHVLTLNNMQFGLLLGVLSVGLGSLAISFSLKGSRVMKTISTNTEETYSMTVGQKVFYTVYPEPVMIDKDEKNILSLDAIGGPMADITITLFLPVLEKEDHLTVTVKMQEPTQRNNEAIVWSGKTREIMGQRKELSFEVFELGSCLTQMEVWVKNNTDHKICIKSLMTYVH
jgi:hypothetical protein